MSVFGWAFLRLLRRRGGVGSSEPARVIWPGMGPARAYDSDNAALELVDLARAGNRSEFDAPAACLMPPAAIVGCWTGVRQRLGLLP